MKPYRTIIALSLALMTAGAAAQGPSPNHALLFPAHRITGLWQVAVTTAPCTGGPTQSFIAYSTYHAGGTLSDTNAFPPTARGPGQGIWEYRGRGQYKSRFQFYRFVEGAFDGVQDIRTQITLNTRANEYDGTVYARVLNADGSLRAELCGTAAGRRIGID